MTGDERRQMDYIIYGPHRADMHTQRGSYYQFRPLSGVYLVPTGFPVNHWQKSDSCSSLFKMDFICFIQWCTRVAQWRASDPGVSSSERTGLYCSLESSLLAPCSDSTVYCSWTEHLAFAEVVSAEKVSQREYVEFRREKTFSCKRQQAFSIPLILTCSLTRSSSSCSQVLRPKSSSYCLCIYRNPYSERVSQLICLRRAKISGANKIKKTNKFFTFHRPVLLLCCSRMALL